MVADYDAQVSAPASGLVAGEGTPDAVEARTMLRASAVTHFKMRAQAQNGGYVTWVVTGAPDFGADAAPDTVVMNSTVVASSWDA